MVDSRNEEFGKFLKFSEKKTEMFECKNLSNLILY